MERVEKPVWCVEYRDRIVEVTPPPPDPAQAAAIVLTSPRACRVVLDSLTDAATLGTLHRGEHARHRARRSAPADRTSGRPAADLTTGAAPRARGDARRPTRAPPRRRVSADLLPSRRAPTLPASAAAVRRRDRPVNEAADVKPSTTACPCASGCVGAPFAQLVWWPRQSRDARGQARAQRPWTSRGESIDTAGRHPSTCRRSNRCASRPTNRIRCKTADLAITACGDRAFLDPSPLRRGCPSACYRQSRPAKWHIRGFALARHLKAVDDRRRGITRKVKS